MVKHVGYPDAAVYEERCGAVSGTQQYSGIFDATGTAWFDCFQLETGSVANKFNMLSNPGFIRSSTNQINDWTYSHSDTNDTWYDDSLKMMCFH